MNEPDSVDVTSEDESLSDDGQLVLLMLHKLVDQAVVLVLMNSVAMIVVELIQRKVTA
jgi:hypothetical protein